MKAAIFRGAGNITVEERLDPVIQEPTDAIVRIVRACVCGSDLWYYRGIAPHPEGSIGHEFIGVVEEVGPEVTTIKRGDFVIAPFAISDGTCPHCRAGFHTACVRGGFFGQGVEGVAGQAELARVPLADGTLVAVPGRQFSDEVLASLLTLTDVMGTGYHAAISAGVKPGQTVAVVGDGAVGLCAVLSARLLGAERVIILSRHPRRQELARDFGATDIVAERGDAAVQAIMRLTDGIGADAVLECVGTNEANQTAFASARPGAIVGRVGVPHEVEIPAEATFYRNVGMRGGPAPVRAYLPELLEAVLSGKINPGRVFDFTTDLDHVAEAYAAMDQRRAIKSLLVVGR
ncbi:MAG: zinc-dependent alcohol dehydrogenase family protein [Thermogemmatispora sp.]|uniref:zinc-dependent alcohol dehydrogenase family protein n=1 Tax=Thermogemmatispora sp. TaxID=1968838 RepID=UPI002609791B|nr:zinc-dependent alcohol dehydrogenase family protein [Thermogemmatispora sp.]MBX5458548.1 zinc-dependent alcohol dehydrogenase family protein [Thermogemmatispora sp.]